jgi:hypothetical protein
MIKDLFFILNNTKFYAASLPFEKTASSLCRWFAKSDSSLCRSSGGFATHNSSCRFFMFRWKICIMLFLCHTGGSIALPSQQMVRSHTWRFLYTGGYTTNSLSATSTKHLCNQSTPQTNKPNNHFLCVDRM